MVADRGCEGAFLVSEELAVDELRGNRGTVDLHIRAHRTVGHLVEVLGDELLAAAVGPGDEHARRGGGHLGYHVLEMPYSLRAADYVLAIDLFLEDAGLGHEVGLVRRVLYGDEDAVDVRRLADEIEGALLDAGHGGLQVAVAGKHDDGALDPVGDKPVQHFDAVHLGHLYIAYNSVEFLLRGLCYRFNAVLSRLHGVVLHFEDVLDGVAYRFFVIDNQNLHNRSFTTGTNLHNSAETSNNHRFLLYL